MGKGSGGSGMTRGDRRRNARRERLRVMLPRDGAVIGIDLRDEKQAIAVVDHDVRVLARKTVRVKAFRLGEALDWAVAQARAKGFTAVAVAVAYEPTGPRWLQLSERAGCAAGAFHRPRPGHPNPDPETGHVYRVRPDNRRHHRPNLRRAQACRAQMRSGWARLKRCGNS